MQRKKIPLFKIIAVGLVLSVITIFFSPMIWLATILAPLPITLMLLLFQPVAYLNLVEKQTQDNRLK